MAAVQMDMWDPELKARDAALDLFEKHKAPAVDLAYAVARSLAHARGHVTSPDVERIIKASPELLDAVAESFEGDIEWRFLGAVFRRKGWRKDGWVEKGSHGRPVPVWRLKEGSS